MNHARFERDTEAQQPWLVALYLAISATSLFTGCGGVGNTMTVTDSNPPPTPEFTGVMESGSNPVSGAAISFYAAGNLGSGAGASNLLGSQTVTTDASGKFSIPVFQCGGSGTQVYLVARGGSASPASSADNDALVMMAALGDCGSIGSATTVVMNEVTTAAAVWALAQFIGTDAVIGASATNAIGLRNAFLTAANLADIRKGTAPGPGLPPNAKLETAKLNTLAAALWTCNQPASSTACTKLFSAVTATNGAPADTLDAALSVVRNPGANPAAVFAIAAQSPFAPVLTTAPHDWTLSATFGNCASGSGCGGLNLPGSLAIDSTGNVWVANYFGGAASEFSNTGVPASAGGYAAAGLQESFGIAVDGQGSAWITNANGNSNGSVTQLSSSGANLSGSGYSGGGIYYPMAVAATSGGEIWVADYANSAATLLASNGAAISGSSGYAPGALPFTTAVATDGNQNGWFAYQGGVAMVTQAGVVNSYVCCNVPAGIALDASGNVWVADYDASNVVKLASSGSVIGETTAGGVHTPVGIVVDGSGNVWTANYRANTVSELKGSTLQAVSPATGYGLDASLYGPFGLGVDASGNVWIGNAYGNTITELIGAAGPAKTPVLGLPAQP
jgi:sugar lactone lactonase YvrE